MSVPMAAIACLLCALITIPAASAQEDAEPEPLPLDSYGPVSPKEALWSVAKSLLPDRPGATTGQIAWALYRANPDAFDGSPGRMRPGSKLSIPDPSFIKAVSPAESYAYVTGARPPAAGVIEKELLSPALAPGAAAATAASPPPAAPATPATPATPAAALPVIAGVELLPVMGKEVRQDFAVAGTGFQPGATLEFIDQTRDRSYAGRKPRTLTSTRIEYAASFGKETSYWQVVVRNPDGQRTAPYEFKAGADVTLVLNLPAPAVPAAATVLTPALATQLGLTQPFRQSGDAKSIAALGAGTSAETRYQKLASLEDSYAGDVDYDYLYGSAAYDSSHYSEGVFILQRAVSSQPEYSGARMELARSYYALGDNESARREFETLKNENPPPDAGRVIAEYLDAIDRRASEYQRQWRATLDYGSGYDSNANGAPDIQTFLGFTLDTRNRSTDSLYYNLGLGGAYSYPFLPEWRALADAQYLRRAYGDAPFVDSDAVRLTGGVEWRPDPFTVSVLPSAAFSYLDGAANNSSTGADLGLGYQRGLWQLGLTTRYSAVRFEDALVLALQEVDTLLVGVTSSQTWLTQPRFQLVAALTFGQDDPVNAASPFGRNLLGERVSASLDFGQSRLVFLSLGFLESDFDGLFFGQPRRDEQVSAALGYEWRLQRFRGWSFRSQLSYVDNQSDVALYDYDRFDAGLSFRKEFK